MRYFFKTVQFSRNTLNNLLTFLWSNYYGNKYDADDMLSGVKQPLPRDVFAMSLPNQGEAALNLSQFTLKTFIHINCMIMAIFMSTWWFQQTRKNLVRITVRYIFTIKLLSHNPLVQCHSRDRTQSNK